ncbi:MAG: hypothetical protein H6650_17795 [Ardenticatenales bacterium]|nr:hypothetical protein [Ardenticatenales bacterium]
MVRASPRRSPLSTHFPQNAGIKRQPSIPPIGGPWFARRTGPASGRRDALVARQFGNVRHI